MPRILKVEAFGDYPKKCLKAQIRLQGLWLIHAGVPPESHVEVTNPQKGILVLRVQEKPESGPK
jgi:hypothetical protein